MPPNKGEATLQYSEARGTDSMSKEHFFDGEKVQYDQDIKWFNVVALFLVHVLTTYALVVGLPLVKASTVTFLVAYGLLTAIGVTAGLHRLWTHRAYKAKLPLRVFLMLCYATAGQNQMHSWVRDHRVHHKFSETPADPHNVNRGLFFSHIGWLMKKKHPICLKQGKKIDMSDIDNDPVVRFFDNNFIAMKTFFCFVIPILFVRYVLGDTWWFAIYGNLVRYVYTLNGTWVINSLAHSFGHHPYDKKISPTENGLATFLSFGEGWHNYHHTFPWDYRTSEMGLHNFNLPTRFIEMCAKFGWAYDLKTVSKDLALKQAEKNGDGSRFVGGNPVHEAKEQ